MKSTLTAAISICLASVGFAAAQSPVATTQPIEQDTKEELEARGKHGHKRSQGRRHHGKRHHRGHVMARMFEGADANKDGMLTRGEMRAATDRRFARLDGDKNGFITKDEAREARKAFHAEMKAKRAHMKAEHSRHMGPHRGKHSKR